MILDLDETTFDRARSASPGTDAASDAVRSRRELALACLAAVAGSLMALALASRFADGGDCVDVVWRVASDLGVLSARPMSRLALGALLLLVAAHATERWLGRAEY